MASEETVMADWVNRTESKIHDILRGERPTSRFTPPMPKYVLASFEMRVDDKQGARNFLLKLYRTHGQFEVDLYTRDQENATWIDCYTLPSNNKMQVINKICISEESEMKWLQAAECACSETNLSGASVSHGKGHVAQLQEQKAKASQETKHDNEEAEDKWAEIEIDAKGEALKAEDDEWLLL